MPTRATRSNPRKPSPASTSSLLSKSAATSKQRSTVKALASTPVPKKKSSRGKAQDVWCICRGPDDSTPMIRCESCKDWFHFTCINLSERDAEEILDAELYVCDACHSRTGQSTVYDWEGPDAVEECVDHKGTAEVSTGTDGVSSIVDDQGRKAEDTSLAMEDDMVDQDDGTEEASGDDYEEEMDDTVVVKRGKGTKRITSSDEEGLHDEDDDDDDDSSWRRTQRNRAQLKRKRGKEAQSVQRKRPRKPSSELTDDDRDQDERHRKKGINKAKTKHDPVLDPTRKYCLGKLRDVLLPIFVQFASESQNSLGERPEDNSAVEPDEEQKKMSEERGGSFVQDLEQCLFELYGEPDKHGQKVAGGKYKDRFRMLSFNLSQPDRHLLRRRIGTCTLPALQLAKMSSIELANEQTKQQVEAANRESLEHSILMQRPAAARAKITHKGEEIIEDLVGDDIGRRIRDEEQREREREKGLWERAKIQPSSPVVPKEPSFKGPQDILAQQHNVASQKAAQIQTQRPPPYPPASSPAEVPPEPSFKFDDLIAIDLPDESSPQDTSILDSQKPPVTAPAPASDNTASEGSAPPTGPQPEATSPTTTHSTSFDLDNVWSGTALENTPQESSGSPILSARGEEARDPPNIDVDLGTAADDEDFDMFLDKPDATASTSLISGQEAERAAFEALPIVWSGNLNLPDAGKSPAVQARQVGGRPIDSASSQWHILFPLHPPHQLKVDGRVPVKESAKYMTQNRMNITRELIVVALTPSADRTDYDEVISFLIKRDRHAVVHPWGPNPGPDAPGKELYLIPIMPHEALPDYVEILDLVKFPKQREDKILLGVFVLNKGKFSERVPPIPLQSASAAPAIPHPNVASTTLGIPALAASLASSSATSGTVQQTQNIPPEIVSKLTAEQIESLLQSVLSGGLNSLSVTPSQPVTSSPPTTYPPAFPSSLTNILPQQYPAVPLPPYAPGPHGTAQYPPPPAHQQPPPLPYNYTQPQPHPPASPPRDTEYRGPSYSSGYSRSGRGDFDRPRGRGSGGRNFSGNERGRGAHASDFDRPRDSGWGARGRGRGYQQNQSPPRHW